MDDNEMIELTQELLDKIDEIVRPLVLFLNPEDAKLLRNCCPNIEKMCVIEEIEFVEHGKCIIKARHMDDFLKLSEVIA